MNAIREQYGDSPLVDVQEAIYNFFRDRKDVQCIHDCAALAERVMDAASPIIDAQREEELKCIIATVDNLRDILESDRRPLEAFGCRTNQEFRGAGKMLRHLSIMLNNRLEA